MRRFNYHGNFCTECGNPLTAQRGWLTRVLCDECAAQLRRAQRIPGRGWPWLWLAVALGLFYLLNHSATMPTAQPVPAAPAHSLATNAVAAPVAAAPVEAQPSFCGARTKRGTPCRRLVKGHERCAQHRGKPSLLKPSTS